jgi:hypothetical protein
VDKAEDKGPSKGVESMAEKISGMEQEEKDKLLDELILKGF